MIHSHLLYIIFADYFLSLLRLWRRINHLLPKLMLSLLLLLIVLWAKVRHLAPLFKSLMVPWSLFYLREKMAIVLCHTKWRFFSGMKILTFI